jgi:hypothetical protein
MPTPILYHGPTARDHAVRAATSGNFRMIADPIGDSGLKVDDSRILVELASVPPVGDKKGSIVLGPLDRATTEASDALLKTLEDLVESHVVIFPWAWDVSGVIPTIRSRTIGCWCPGNDPLAPLDAEAKELVKSVVTNKLVGVAAILDGKSDGEREDLVIAMQPHLLKIGEDGIDIWVRVRDMITGKGISKIPLICALMGY